MIKFLMNLILWVKSRRKFTVLNLWFPPFPTTVWSIIITGHGLTFFMYFINNQTGANTCSCQKSLKHTFTIVLIFLLSKKKWCEVFFELLFLLFLFQWMKQSCHFSILLSIVHTRKIQPSTGDNYYLPKGRLLKSPLRVTNRCRVTIEKNQSGCGYQTWPAVKRPEFDSQPSLTCFYKLHYFQFILLSNNITSKFIINIC